MRRVAVLSSVVSRKSFTVPWTIFPAATHLHCMRGSSTTSRDGAGTSSSPTPVSLAEKGFVHATPNFPGDFTAASDADIGEIDTSPATNVDFVRDIAGPWLMMTDDLQGELFVEPDGSAFYRPAANLGYGIGRCKISHSSIGVATFTLDLETYGYQNIAAVPPERSTLYSVKGIVASAHAAKKNYKTFTLHGTIRKENGVQSNAAVVDAPFNAAKLAQWDQASQPPAWQPDAIVHKSLNEVFRSDPKMFDRSKKARPDGLRLEQFKVGDIDSVFYVPNYVTEDEESAMLAQLKATPEALKSKLTKRLVQEWGCSMCPKCNQSFVFDANLPPWTSLTADLLVRDKVFTPATFPNNIRIHEYEQGEGIAPHVDGPIYVPLVAIISLASTSVMAFYPRREPYDQPMEHYNDTFKFDGEIVQQRPHMSVVLEPRSLLIFRSEAYSHYPHGISDKKVDILDESVAGPVVNRHLLRQQDISEVVRKYRVGITVRNLLPRCNHQPERAEYAMKRAWSIYHDRADSEHEVSKASAQQPPAATPSNQRAATPRAATPPSPPAPSARALDGDTASALGRVEAKLDRLLTQQDEMRASIRELQEVVAFTTASSANFRTEMSTILNYMSSTVLQMESRVDEIAARGEPLDGIASSSTS